MVEGERRHERGSSRFGNLIAVLSLMVALVQLAHEVNPETFTFSPVGAGTDFYDDIRQDIEQRQLADDGPIDPATGLSENQTKMLDEVENLHEEQKRRLAENREPFEPSEELEDRFRETVTSLENRPD